MHFLDQLDIVWLRQLDQTQQLELKNLLIGTAAGVVARPPVPCVAAFLSLFDRELNPERLASLLGDNSLQTYASYFLESRNLLAQIEELSDIGQYSARRGHFDHRRAEAEGRSLADRQMQLDRQFLCGVQDAAVQVHRGLTKTEGGLYLSRIANGTLDRTPGWPCRVTEEVPVLHLLPAHHCANIVQRAANDDAGAKKSLTGKYFRDRSGDVFDWDHLVGAAYADVFCCDKLVAKRLGATRRRLGFNNPLVFDGDKMAFAKRLEEAAL